MTTDSGRQSVIYVKIRISKRDLKVSITWLYSPKLSSEVIFYFDSFFDSYDISSSYSKRGTAAPAKFAGCGAFDRRYNRLRIRRRRRTARTNTLCRRQHR